MMPSADPVRFANTAPPATPEIKIELAGEKPHLPNVAVGEDVKQSTNGDTESGKKFDFYSLKVVQEREAIKRTFQSVNKRLQEEFKKRKLAGQPVSEASNQANNTAK
jgi:hypothetical protein